MPQSRTSPQGVLEPGFLNKQLLSGTARARVLDKQNISSKFVSDNFQSKKKEEEQTKRKTLPNTCLVGRKLT